MLVVLGVGYPGEKNNKLIVTIINKYYIYDNLHCWANDLVTTDILICDVDFQKTLEFFFFNNQHFDHNYS